MFSFTLKHTLRTAHITQNSTMKRSSHSKLSLEALARSSYMKLIFTLNTTISAGLDLAHYHQT